MFPYSQLQYFYKAFISFCAHLFLFYSFLFLSGIKVQSHQWRSQPFNPCEIDITSICIRFQNSSTHLRSHNLILIQSKTYTNPYSTLLFRLHFHLLKNFSLNWNQSRSFRFYKQRRFSKD